MADLPAELQIPDGLSAEDVRVLACCLASVIEVDAGDTLPTIAPALLLGHPSLAPYTAKMLPPDGMGLVHESQSFQRSAVLPLGDPLAVGAELTEKGAARVFDFSVTDRDQTALGAMQTRLRVVTPEDMGKFKGSQFPPHMDKGDVVWRESQLFDDEVVRRYLALARDPNPIHTSDEAARRVGLGGAVVPGMLFAGVIDYVLAAVLPDVVLAQMKLRFMAPVAVGEGLRYGVLTRATDAAGRAKTVRVFVLRYDNIIAAIADLEMLSKDQAT